MSLPRYQTLPLSEFERIVRDGRILEQDGYGLKIVMANDGTLFKIYRRKRWLSSALLRPYATRFATNARQLRKRGIAAPEVLALYRIPLLERTAVQYRPLPGRDLRQVLGELESRCNERAELFLRLGEFAARLHEAGVFFRAMHFGNVLCLKDGDFGLIDLADLSAGQRLSARDRLRAWHCMTRYRGDAEAIHPCFDEFWQGYSRASGLDDEWLRRRFTAVLAANLDSPRLS